MTKEQEAELLRKSYWSLADIQLYIGCGRSKASKIRQEAKNKFDGLNRLLPQKVKREAVFKALQIKNI